MVSALHLRQSACLCEMPDAQWLMALHPASPPVFKIPQSVLVLIHTPALEVLLIRRTEPDPQAPAFWQSVTGSKDAHGEPWAYTAAREVYEETGIDCRQGSPLAAQLQDWHLENVYPIYPRWLHRYAPGVAFNTERLFGLQVPAGTPVLVAGDFNEWGGLLERELGSVGLSAWRQPGFATFPSRLPLLQLDHVYARGLRPLGLEVPRGGQWPRLSDHLPLIAEFELPRAA